MAGERKWRPSACEFEAVLVGKSLEDLLAPLVGEKYRRNLLIFVTRNGSAGSAAANGDDQAHDHPVLGVSFPLVLLILRQENQPFDIRGALDVGQNPRHGPGESRRHRRRVHRLRKSHWTMISRWPTEPRRIADRHVRAKPVPKCHRWQFRPYEGPQRNRW